MLNKICGELGVPLEKEWESNHGDIHKITRDGMLLYWNDIDNEWENYPQGWSSILSGKLINKNHNNVVNDKYLILKPNCQLTDVYYREIGSTCNIEEAEIWVSDLQNDDSNWNDLIIVEKVNV